MPPPRLGIVLFALAAVIWPAAPPVSADQTSVPQAPTAPRSQPGAEPVPATGILRGRVLAADTGGPLRRARITLDAPELGRDARQATSTDADGRYEFTGLRPARYRVSVTRGGYLPLQYGQRRPGEQGRPVQLEEGQTLESIDFALPRMSVISGRVTDEVGEPIEGISVYAMRSLFFEGRRRLVPVSMSAQTDDTGEYRIQRLAPGTYTVMASTRETWVRTENGTSVTFGYLPTYFPGVPNGAAAERLTLGVGQVATAVDVTLVPGRAPRVSGVAFDSGGRPFSRVSLREEVRGLGFGSFRGGPEAPVNADGSFTFSNVPPGEYTLTANRMPGEAGAPEVALLPVVVDGTDIQGLVLSGSAGGTIKGRLLSESGTMPSPSAVRIAVLEPLRNQPNPVLLGTFRGTGGGWASTTVSEDATFTVEHVFGRARFQVTLPEGWMLQRITHEGRDITDAPIELRSGGEISGVDVVITDRLTRVFGQLVDGRSVPLRDATVLIFPADPDAWFENSRRMQAARPDQRGAWEVKGLPPGDYLAVALDYVDEEARHDPEYLEGLREAARPVSLAEGEAEAVMLTLTVPQQ